MIKFKYVYFSKSLLVENLEVRTREDGNEKYEIRGQGVPEWKTPKEPIADFFVSRTSHLIIKELKDASNDDCLFLDVTIGKEKAFSLRCPLKVALMNKEGGVGTHPEFVIKIDDKWRRLQDVRWMDILSGDMLKAGVQSTIEALEAQKTRKQIPAPPRDTPRELSNLERTIKGFQKAWLWLLVFVGTCTALSHVPLLGLFPWLVGTTLPTVVIITPFVLLSFYALIPGKRSKLVLLPLCLWFGSFFYTAFLEENRLPEERSFTALEEPLQNLVVPVALNFENMSDEVCNSECQKFVRTRVPNVALVDPNENIVVVRLRTSDCPEQDGTIPSSCFKESAGTLEEIAGWSRVVFKPVLVQRENVAPMFLPPAFPKVETVTTQIVRDGRVLSEVERKKYGFKALAWYYVPYWMRKFSANFSGGIGEPIKQLEWSKNKPVEGRGTYHNRILPFSGRGYGESDLYKIIKLSNPVS